ncbi:MAG: FkbM family methyltransferase [Desulfamplus sp.]|nr:FkbM family methyltransferase [Desulfamplus sp.]
MTNSISPIVLFTYNRPWHTQKTIEALKVNEMAKESELFIYSDGSKSELDTPKVNEVRNYLKKIDGFKNIRIIERKTNWGLADNIIDGVTNVVNLFEQVIVLEDDIITGPYFLDFMNDALNVYRHEKKVMHVSGYLYPSLNNFSGQDSFFLNVGTCWGWATWKRAWQYMETDPEKLLSNMNDLHENEIERFNLDGGYDWYSHLHKNATGEMKTWAIRWYTSFFLKGGYGLHPKETLTVNIGTDGSGVHCAKNGIYLDQTVSTKKITVNKEPLSENQFIRNKLKIFFLKQSQKLIPLSAEDTEKLKKSQRFVEHEIMFFDTKIRVPDSASFLFLVKEIFYRQIYRFQISKYNPYIIDCGSNIGLSILYFKHLYPESEIIGFEPDDNIFKYLQHNINAHKFKQVSLIAKALWSSECELEFFPEGADGGRLGSATINNFSHKVQTTTLSPYLAEREVDFLKIDIEGAEHEVLSECQDYLKNVKRIYIEYHSLDTSEQKLSDVLSILLHAGFRFHIEHLGVQALQPFVEVKTRYGFDNQLHIFAYK